MKNKYKKIMFSDRTTRDEHVLIIEEYLGRPLEPDECVYHCNEQKGYNEIENLELMLKAEHSRMHMMGHIPSNRKFSDKQVREIRNSELGCIKLSRLHKVDKKTIQHIRNFRSYKNVV